jgi:hypothetical protein
LKVLAKIPSYSSEDIIHIEAIDGLYIRESKKEYDFDETNYRDGVKELSKDLSEEELKSIKLEYIDMSLSFLNRVVIKMEEWKLSCAFDKLHPDWLWKSVLDILRYSSILKERGSLLKRKVITENPQLLSKNWVSQEEIAIALKVSFNTLVKLNHNNSMKCPFHSDKDPSFHVFKNNTAHCFGCNWDGTIISYVMESQSLKFNEAVRYLIG